MKLQVTGKNLDVTQPIVDYAERKLTKLAKHLSDSSRVELELAVERKPSISQSQVAEATIWTKGPVLRARESSTDMYASIDLVADKLERQVKKYRARRQRGRPHGHGRSPEPPPVELPPSAVILSEEDEGELPPLEDEARDPGIVKTKRFNMKPMHPEEAALQLDLVGHDFFVFLSSETEEVAVIYRRRDGNFGVIEPVRGYAPAGVVEVVGTRCPHRPSELVTQFCDLACNRRPSPDPARRLIARNPSKSADFAPAAILPLMVPEIRRDRLSPSPPQVIELHRPLPDQERYAVSSYPPVGPPLGPVPDWPPRRRRGRLGPDRARPPRARVSPRARPRHRLPGRNFRRRHHARSSR